MSNILQGIHVDSFEQVIKLFFPYLYPYLDQQYRSYAIRDNPYFCMTRTRKYEREEGVAAKAHVFSASVHLKIA